MNEKSEGTRSDREAIEKVMAEFRSHLTQTEQKLNADYKANLEMLKTDPELMENAQKMLDEIKKLKAAHKRKLVANSFFDLKSTKNVVNLSFLYSACSFQKFFRRFSRTVEKKYKVI